MKMKKAFLLLLMSLFSLVLFAQTEHMKFAGIPLTGSIEQFQKKLIAKGFRLNSKISKLLPVGTRSFIGTFAGEKGNIAVYYDPDTKTVYGAKVYYDGLTDDKAEEEMDNLRSILSAKYGEDNITDGKDKSNRDEFHVDTGLGTIYCYLMMDESMHNYPYNWSVHAEFMDYKNGRNHQSKVMDDF